MLTTSSIVKKKVENITGCKLDLRHYLFKISGSVTSRLAV